MKYIIFLFCLFAVSCATQTASKNTDLKSPCAGCDDRVSPAGNIKYLV